MASPPAGGVAPWTWYGRPASICSRILLLKIGAYCHSRKNWQITAPTAVSIKTATLSIWLIAHCLSILERCYKDMEERTFQVQVQFLTLCCPDSVPTKGVVCPEITQAHVARVAFMASWQSDDDSKQLTHVVSTAGSTFIYATTDHDHNPNMPTNAKNASGRLCLYIYIWSHKHIPSNSANDISYLKTQSTHNTW